MMQQIMDIPPQDDIDPASAPELPPAAKEINAIAIQPQDPVPALPGAQQNGYMAIIEKMASNPTLQSVEIMERMMAMQERWEQKQAAIEYNQAMIRLKEKLPVIKKNGVISFSGTSKQGNAYTQETAYAKYEDIHKAIKPFMKEEGFTINFFPQVGEKIMLTAKISHSAGHSETSSMSMPLDTSGSKNNLQAGGSTLSYCKRYLLTSMLDIATEGEDNDGAGAPITDEQAKEIKDGLRETEADVAGFLKYMKASSVEEILTRDLEKARTAIQAKRAKKAKQEAKNANPA